MIQPIDYPSNALDILNYYKTISAFSKAGYSFLKFSPLNVNEFAQPYVYWRHDVDFSIRYALELAKADHLAGIEATFFFHLRSPIYNILSDYANTVIKEIYNLGHDVCLHFDMSNYLDKDILSALMAEMDIFLQWYSFANSKIVSFHKIGVKAFELEKLTLPDGIHHTYEKRYFYDVSYFSDSGGLWKRGNPTLSSDFAERMSMQVLTHPLWWIESGQGPIQKFNQLLKGNREEDLDFLERTAISYSLVELRQDSE